MVANASLFTRSRSILIAPAVRPDFLAKLPNRGADVLFIDCEDAVPADSKQRARHDARAATEELTAAGCTVVVRVNAVDSVWFNDDISAVSPAAAAVVIPKVEAASQLQLAEAALDGGGLDALGIVAGLETAKGVLDARPLLGHDRVVAAYFGAEDLIADMGGVRSQDNAEVATARAMTVMAAKVAAKPLWDQVVTGFRDGERFEREAIEARNLGYRGKLCIHPAQVEAANRAFSPSSEEIGRARRLLDAYRAAVERGQAAIDFEGQMVDEPLATQARRVLERAGHYDA